MIAVLRSCIMYEIEQVPYADTLRRCDTESDIEFDDV